MGSVKVSYGAGTRVRIRRHHKCLNCQHEFNYEMNRAIGASSKHGTVAATNLAKQKLSDAVRGEVAVFPCPRCQFIQPEMVNEARDVRDGSSYWTFALSGFVLLIISLFFPRFSLGVWGFMVLMEIWIIWGSMLDNPNSGRTWNLGDNYPGNEGKFAGSKPFGFIFIFISAALLFFVYRFLPNTAKMPKYIDTPEFYTFFGLFLASIVSLCIGIAILVRASRVGDSKTVTILHEKTTLAALSKDELTSGDIGYDGL